MLLLECKKCGKGFIPKEDLQPFIITSGLRPSIRDDENKRPKCPYCGHSQDKVEFMFPL